MENSTSDFSSEKKDSNSQNEISYDSVCQIIGRLVIENSGIKQVTEKYYSEIIAAMQVQATHLTSENAELKKRINELEGQNG
jgi:hypothetical protein|tara:strand:+ start:504 stop:749 length:246 start_codon:yes stop_codon:yes gene_type:complete